MTKNEISQALQIVQALGEAVKSARKVPSGHLYAMVAHKISLAEYNGAIGLLKRQNIIREEYHELIWNGKD